ncbi:MAG: hypothetical protein BWK76_17490 [Desulfobulbaceae bacterium A2]|nr:MAG: hypothetical protein BWK76_17490 [Desulfobulbaceae bacterium A2]
MQCPGQDTRYWSGDDVFEAPCPQCGHSVEFFKDDSQRGCAACGHRFPNPRLDFGCAAYCPFAAQCLGALPESMAAQRDELLRERLQKLVGEHLGADSNARRRAEQAAALAEEIGKREGAATAVVLASALLHGLPPETVRAMLESLRADAALREAVTGVLGDQTPDQGARLESLVVSDACCITALTQEWSCRSPAASDYDEALAALRTATGRDIGQRELGRFRPQ